MTGLEIEVKFFLSDRESVRTRLLELGAVSSGRFFEQNIRFEDEQNSFIQKKALLRLRQDRKVCLTFKSEPGETSLKSGQFKVFREIEVEVSNFEGMKAILEAAGFHAEQIYEKWRETFALGATRFCLDTMPFGEFLEIEGNPYDIRTCSDRIGLHWNRRILENYLIIFENIRQALQLPFSDVTFNHFKQVKADPAPYIQRLEAGNSS